MKKLMLAAALIAASTVANAAVSLSWGANWLVGHDFDPASPASLGTSGTAYLVDANIYTTLLADAADGKFNSSSTGIMYTTGLLNDGDSDYGTYFAIVPEVATDITAKNASWTSGQAASLYTVIVDGDWVGISTESVNKAIPADKNTLVAEYGQMSDWDAGTQKMSWATASSPTPEPTSGLLLLIGMAGLALRRRRA